MGILFKISRVDCVFGGILRGLEEALRDFVVMGLFDLLAVREEGRGFFNVDGFADANFRSRTGVFPSRKRLSCSVFSENPIGFFRL